MVLDTPKDMTEGGIHIPTTAKQTPQTGTAIAVGAGFWSEFPIVTASRPDKPIFGRMPMTIKAGDKILCSKNSGMEVKIDREFFLVLRETDILAKVVEEDDV